MNRKQAENILDAYVRLRVHKSDRGGSDALREVILDAMTEQNTNVPKSNITSPYATWCELDSETKLPTVWDCTGVDPAFRTNTAEAVE